MKTSLAVPVDEEMGIHVYSPAGQIVSTSSQQIRSAPTSFVYPVAIPVAETRPVRSLQIASTSSPQSDFQTSVSPTSFVQRGSLSPHDPLQRGSLSPHGREYANGFQRPDATRQIISSCFVFCFVVITISLSIYGINQVRNR